MRAERGTVKEVVAERQRDRPVADVFTADHERLGETLGRMLQGVGDVDAELRAVTEESLKGRHVGG